MAETSGITFGISGQFREQEFLQIFRKKSSIFLPFVLCLQFMYEFSVGEKLQEHLFSSRIFRDSRETPNNFGDL